MAVELSLANILNYGDQLRSVNAEIKTVLQEIGRQPVGSTPYGVATALHNLQTKYNEARELYTTIYRAVYGEVPSGLGVFPLAAVPLAAWVSLVVAMGVLYTYINVLKDLVQAWREQRSGSLQQSKTAVLQANLNRAESSGDASAVAFYRQQLAATTQQPAIPSDLVAWVQSNALYVGAGFLVLMFLLSKKR